MDILDDEILFVGTAEAEHIEMYLKGNLAYQKKEEEMSKLALLQKCSMLDSQV